MSISLQSSSTWDVADASQNPAQSSPEVEKAAKSSEGSEISSEFFAEYFFLRTCFHFQENTVLYHCWKG